MNIHKRLTILVLFFLIAVSCMADNQFQTEPEYGPETGALQIGSTPPGAAVYLYNDFEGNTPGNGYLIKSNLNPGDYPLRLNLSGYTDYAIDVLIPRNRVVTVDAVLWPVTDNISPDINGNLTIQSNPAKADVFFDDDYRGITPLILENVKAGYHNLEIKKDGYVDYSDKITVSSNQTTMITANLTLN